MSGRIFFFLLGALIFFGNPVNAQVKRTKTFDQSRYKKQKAPKSSPTLQCPLFEKGKYPYQSIGAKLGDPFAVTYKIYPYRNFALAIDAGSPSSGLYDSYNKGNFVEYLQYDTLGEGEAIAYIDHEVLSDWMVEAKIVYHLSLAKAVKGLSLYGGGGWQYRTTEIQYDYMLFFGLNDDETGNFVVNRTYSGPVGAIGIEYSYFKIPMAAFVEVEVFRDLKQDPGWTRLQGGVGLRYVF
ncbi:hypothetical protein [Fulvivirga sedimenti]|uniref:Uncharacterized protein n=1 Tax=Fulvivirga sedimenti TaxID=2879465 RepID=A0A9X1HUQ0_9BACT|nr:hypothetical protein [Fulvivirga sedimenti]MCA6078654.1 hypothetical protein [Fulvivirga sedimenti]